MHGSDSLSVKGDGRNGWLINVISEIKFSPFSSEISN